MKRILTLLSLAVAFNLSATIHTVSDPSDSGPGTLRDIIASSGSGDTIRFSVTDTIQLNTVIVLTNSLVFDGSTASSPVVISGTHSDRIFYENATGTVDLTFSQLTLTKGYTINMLGGTAINANSANITLSNCTISDCQVASNNGRGAAISMTSGTLTIEGCEIYDNRINFTSSPNPGTSNKMYGGAMFLQSVSSISINNSTITNNWLKVYAEGRGGAIFMLGCPNVAITNSTFEGNYVSSTLPRASGGSAIYFHSQSQVSVISLIGNTIAGNVLPDRNNANYIEGGTIHFNGVPPTSTVNIASNIIYDNIIAAIADDSLTDISSTGVLPLGGYNFLGYTPRSHVSIQGTDQFGVDPMLGPLQNNGGSTRTMGFDCSSPAYRSGDPTMALSLSQNQRTRKNNPDAGAFEFRLNMTGTNVTEPNCFAEGSGSINLVSPVLSYDYAWSAGLTSGKKGTNVTGVSGGIVQLYISESSTSCVDTFDIIVNQPDEILVSGVVTNDLGGNSGAIDVSVSGGTQVSGYDFTWAPNGELTEDISGLSANNYTVTVADDNQCEVEETFTVSLVTDLFDNPKVNNHHLFPSLTSGDLQITNLEGVQECVIISMTGVQYHERIINGSLNVKQIPNGRYLVRIVSEDVSLSFQKF